MCPRARQAEAKPVPDLGVMQVSTPSRGKLLTALQLHESTATSVSLLVVIIANTSLLAPGTSGADPPIHIVPLELPEPARSVRRHALSVNPLVYGVARHADMGAYLVNGQPAIFHGRSPT